MNKTAWLFPGQASQKVGMGLDLYEKTDIGKTFFDIADDIMGFDLKSIIFHGPEQTLKETRFTQPSIYIVSVILGKLLMQKGLSPSTVAGHSLGEYSALSVADSFDFETGLKLVKIRSEKMSQASKENKGIMAAIVGLQDEKITSLCKDYSGIGVVVPANFNSPGQVVISGSSEAVRSVMKTSKNSGARMAVELNVSGAFHSPLMKSAREGLAEMLNSLEINDSKYPIFTNVYAKPITKGSEIKESLIKQLENPVQWTKSIIEMNKTSGINSFIEVGPGKVLQGLNKRIDRSFNSVGVESYEHLEGLNV